MGRARGMDWVTTGVVMEEIGTLGYEFACRLRVGAELVCDAIVSRTDEQKEKYVKPLFRRGAFAAECLTEPRAALISSGPQSRLRTKAIISFSMARRGSSWGAEGADFFLVYARTTLTRKVEAQDASPLHRRPGPGVETKYL